MSGAGAMRPATIRDWLMAVVWTTSVLATVLVAMVGYRASFLPPYWHGVLVGFALVVCWPSVVRVLRTLAVWALVLGREGR